MKNRTAKITAVIGACAILMLCSVGMAQSPGGVSETSGTSGTYGRIQEYETVFCVLASDGMPESTTVVDWIRVPQGGPVSVFDPGNIENPVNLRNAEVPDVVSGGLRWNADPTRITDINYSGTSKKQLPIGVKVTYKLNGKVVPASAVPGSSGRLEVTVDLVNRTARKENLSYTVDGKNTTFAEDVCVPMIVQVSTDVPLPDYTLIQAPDATTVLAGKSLKINWTLMPNPDASCTLVLEGENIQLNDIDVTVIPSMPPIPQLEELLDTAIDALGMLASGVDQLDSAIEQAQSGTLKLADGQAQVADGMIAIGNGVSDLSKLADAHWTIAKTMNDAITPEMLEKPKQLIELVESAKPILVKLSDTISEAMSSLPMDQLGTAAELAPKLLEQATELNDKAQRVSKGLSSCSQTITQAKSASSESMAALEALAKSNPEITKSLQYKKLESSIKKQDALLETAKSGGRVGFSQVPSIDELAEDAKSVASVGSKAKIAISLASSQLSKVSLDSVDDYLNQAMGAVEVLNALLYGGTVQGHEVPSIDEICDNLRKLDEGAHDLKTGLSLLAVGGTVDGQNVPGLDTAVSGLEALVDGISKLSNGTVELTAGTKELASGLGRIRNEGTSEMKKGINEGLAEALKAKAQLDAMKVRLDQYDTFEGKPAGAAGEVRFLMKVKAPSNKG
ncbi:MAG TPA: hypothetical protein PKH75_08150 [Bacillota bacterium]|nr:hypothetical protein [Bacillota bacterium]